MNAIQQVLEYAKAHNTDSNCSAEAFAGKMIEGVVINRELENMTVAKLAREGKTMIITETTIEEKPVIENGKVRHEKVETTIEILRATL